MILQYQYYNFSTPSLIYSMILEQSQQHMAPKNFKLFTILQRKYVRYFYPYLLNKNALQNQKLL